MYMFQNDTDENRDVYILKYVVRESACGKNGLLFRATEN